MENKEFYTIDDVKKIKQDTINKIKKENILNFSAKLSSIIANNEVIREKKNIFKTKFNRDNVSTYLANPQKYEKELRELSVVLTTVSPQYQSLIEYFSSICRFIPVVNVNMDKYSSIKSDEEKIKKVSKDYHEAIALVDNMNIQHEFQKIASVCYREDVFYGYEYETKDSYYIQPLDSDRCRISEIIDGCFAFEFDFKYFDDIKKVKNTDDNILIDRYPSEFQEKYAIYKAMGNKFRWQTLDYNKTICIKYFENLPFSFPPFANLFDDIADLSDYKELNKTKNEVDNYKFIGLQIPTLSKAEKADDFAVDPDTALAFYQMILNSLPKGIGAFISATDFKDINFNSSASTEKDEVSNAENSILLGSGVSPIVFGKGANNGGTVKYSNKTDQAKIFKFYRQFERWLNRKLKTKFKGRIKVKLLNVTEWNIDEERDNLLKNAQYGVPNKIELMALNNTTQQEMEGSMFLENEVLKLHDKWIPLQSSHTQSGTESEGRTPKDDTELTESGTQSREDDVNANR